jgi:hypothetical protein
VYVNSLRCMCFAGAMALLFSEVGRADIWLTDCGDCYGAAYALRYDPNPIETTPAYALYDVTLMVDLTRYSYPLGAGQSNFSGYIRDVAIKIASATADGKSDSVSQLVSAPPGDWSLATGGLSAGGCNGSGSGFLCAEGSASAAVPHAGLYGWEFYYAVPAGKSLLAGDAQSSIKVQYEYSYDEAAKKNLLRSSSGQYIVSQDVTLESVPEPVWFPLITGVVIGVGSAFLRRYA